MPRHLTPHVDTPVTALEVLCRLAGRTSFVVPAAGRGGGGGIGSAVDIAHALGAVADPLGQAMAMAMACRTLTEESRIVELAYPGLLAELKGNWRTHAWVKGPLRFRARLVLPDAVRRLVYPERYRWPGRQQERIHKMRRQVYLAIHRHAVAYLENAAASAAHDACQRLFGR